MEFTIIAEKLAEIKKQIRSLVEKINKEAGGEPFYARIFLSKNDEIIGLIKDLRANEYNLVFDITEDKVIDGKLFQKTSMQKIPFEKILRIEVFRTISGKPMFIGRGPNNK